jgi:hypothetical protein
MSPLNAAICKTISYTLWVEWYYLKNNYLTLRSKVKVPRRSLRYTTHHLMVMHPHTNHRWPISKDKHVMARTRKYYLKTIIWPWGQGSRSHKGHYGTRHTALWSCTYMYELCQWTVLLDLFELFDLENVMARTRKYYLKNNYLTLRSRSHEGHYGMRHTALWSCTYELSVN